MSVLVGLLLAPAGIASADVGSEGATDETSETGTASVIDEALSASSPGLGIQSVTASMSFDTIPASNNTATAQKPQSKTWHHAGHWWTVVSSDEVSPPGAWVWRRNTDGTWLNVLHLSPQQNGRADVKQDGDVAHVALHYRIQGASFVELVSIELDADTRRYVPWSERSSITRVDLGNTSDTSTIDIDSTGRMWLAYDTPGNVRVSWSDHPYNDFSARFGLTPSPAGIAADDLAVVTAMPDNTVAVMWSDQTTKRFGFKVHKDGDPPDVWSDDEVPAAQSAVDDVGGGMADDHINVAVASNGTLYAAVKTEWDTPGYPMIALLVRRPNGSWDDLYHVDYPGTRPIVLLNEQQGTVQVVYTSRNGFNEIVSRTSSLDNIEFGSRTTLIETTDGVNNVTSTKSRWTNEVLLLATGQDSRVHQHMLGDSPQPNQPPVVEPIEDQQGDVGDEVDLRVVASDPDGDPLTYQAEGLPAGVGIGAGTGRITGTLTDAGEHEVVVTVTDPEGAAGTATFSWSVAQPNRAPVVVPVEDQQGDVGDEVDLRVVASDPDGDPLTYQAVGLPAGVGIGAGTGRITGTLTDAGEHEVVVTVTDPEGAAGTATFSWNVAPASDPSGPGSPTGPTDPGEPTGPTDPTDPTDPGSPTPPEERELTACGEAHSAGFVDVDGGVHAANIDCLAWWGIVKGFEDGTYGPRLTATRAQMASYIARTLDASTADLPPAVDQGFRDIAGSPHEDAINRLAAVGIVLGTEPGIYDPHAQVSRAQTVSLIVRAYEFATGETLPQGRDRFRDDDGSVHETNINKGAEAGFVHGTSSTTFAPNNPVRRDQLASFIVRALDRLAVGGHVEPPA